MTAKDDRIDDAKRMMREAIEEIDRLRRANEIMSAQLDIVYMFDRAIRAQSPMRSEGYAPDIAWTMRRFLDEPEPRD